jgi:hypothetical protein
MSRCPPPTGGGGLRTRHAAGSRRQRRGCPRQLGAGRYCWKGKRGQNNFSWVTTQSLGGWLRLAPHGPNPASRPDPPIPPDRGRARPGPPADPARSGQEGGVPAAERLPETADPDADPAPVRAIGAGRSGASGRSARPRPSTKGCGATSPTGRSPPGSASGRRWRRGSAVARPRGPARPWPSVRFASGPAMDHAGNYACMMATASRSRASMRAPECLAQCRPRELLCEVFSPVCPRTCAAPRPKNARIAFTKFQS